MKIKLVSGDPFWPAKDERERKYAPLRKALDTEILIIGGGITSALIALAFYRAGKQVTLVSEQQLGLGSTSASTALLQYEIDENLIDLKKLIGKKEAELAYQLCGQAIDSIAAIDKAFPSDFAYRPSIFLAAKKADVKTMRHELEARQSAGFDAKWLDAKALESEYGFHAPGAIYSRLGGEIDPYKLTQQIFAHLHANGVPIYERTQVIWDYKDGHRLKTKDGHALRAKRSIFATGYRSQAYLGEQVVKLHSTYAFVTPPLPEDAFWPEKALWWDSADPYLYARATADGRVMIGGGDKDFYQSRLREAAHRRQIASVVERARSYYPTLAFDIDSSWNGVFGETKDGLAYIGEPEDWTNADFALGFGGNGITYSQLAADLLVQKYEGDAPAALSLFRFGR